MVTILEHKSMKNIQAISNQINLAPVPEYQQILNFFPSAEQFTRSLLNLTRHNRYGYPAFSIESHGERDDALDFIEMNTVTTSTGIGIYCDSKGQVSFSVLDNVGNSARGEKPKIDSKGNRYDDAFTIVKVLGDFINKMGCDQVTVDGPNENEPYAVMRVSGSSPKAIATVPEGEIIGFVFKPINGKKIHGKVELLIREKN
ncbi:MAG: hypothetical protein AAB437_04595 [Patescibacteria group bacterium]